MFFIIGVGVLIVASINFVAYKLGIAKGNWLRSLEISPRYMHIVVWAAVILTIVGLSGVQPSAGIAFGIAIAASVLGFFSELIQERIESRR